MHTICAHPGRFWAGLSGTVAAVALLATLLPAAAAAPAAADVRRPDFVIASVGDSYAAGEGTPFRAGSFDDDGVRTQGGSRETWGGFAALGGSYDFSGDTDADLCHRSRNAGAAVAAKTLQDRYPGIHVVFRSFACSGATIPKGLLGPYDGADAELKPSRRDLRPQIQQLDDFVAGRADQTLDALVVGIGGNDLGFPGIVVACLIPGERLVVVGAALGSAVSLLLGGPILGYSFAPTAAIVGGMTGASLAGCQGWGLEALLLDAGIPAVRDGYGQLARAIRGTRAGPSNVRLRFAPKKVYLTEYPDPSRDATGSFCNAGEAWMAHNELYANITRDEARWLSRQALPRINGAVRDGARTLGATYVGGLADAFQTHGVCSSSSWFNPNSEALHRQGGDDVLPRWQSELLFSRPLSGGVAHPNVAGQAEFGRRIFGKLEEQLRDRFAVTAAPTVSVARFRSNPPSPQDAFKLRLTWTTTGIDAPILRWEVRDGSPEARLRPISIPTSGDGAPRSFVFTGRGSFTFTVRGCGHIGCGPWSAPVAADVP